MTCSKLSSQILGIVGSHHVSTTYLSDLTMTSWTLKFEVFVYS